MEALPDGKLVHQGWSPQCESGPALSDGDWGALKTTAIQDGAFLPEHNKRLPDSLDPKPRLEVHPGDVLLTCAGPRARCGVACLVRTTPPRRFISGKMYRFRADAELLDARYLEAFLRTPETKAQIDAMKTGISESALNNAGTRAVACFPGDCQWCELQD
jgi:type I restriction enzyme, S subunit